ncbi:MAG: hypothetical protein MJK14_17635 [Rivularia sp. ALOHA_DT_140]|nr:hypothetical protein [Rivularia sp. ALOHA_DT_140]
MKFKPTIPPGEHLLQVKYWVFPSSDAFRSGTDFLDYIISYILVPARSWTFFKRLDIEIQLPKNWNFDTSLAMEEADNVLKATFNQIPADYFAFSTTPYFSWYVTSSITLTQIIFYLGGLIASSLVGKITHVIIKKRFQQPLFIAAIVAFFLGIIVFAVLSISGLFLADALSNTLSIQQHIWVGNSNNAFLLAVILVFFGLIISGFIAVFSLIYFANNPKMYN